jgi:hypothetical protein
MEKRGFSKCEINKITKKSSDNKNLRDDSMKQIVEKSSVKYNMIKYMAVKRS